MGKLLSKIFGNKEMRILMLGLDAAGKTSILFTNFPFIIIIILAIKRPNEFSLFVSYYISQ